MFWLEWWGSYNFWVNSAKHCIGLGHSFAKNQLHCIDWGSTGAHLRQMYEAFGLAVPRAVSQKRTLL